LVIVPVQLIREVVQCRGDPHLCFLESS